MPIVAGMSITLYLDPTAGLRHVIPSADNTHSYIPYVRGDGTEFHYTWTPTAEYREHYGHLSYRMSHRLEESDAVVAGLDGVPVPNMLPVRSTPVTSVMHQMAVFSGHGNLYDALVSVLSDEMNNVDPSTLADGVPGVVTPEMHSPFSRRHHPDPRDTEAGLPAQAIRNIQLLMGQEKESLLSSSDPEDRQAKVDLLFPQLSPAEHSELATWIAGEPEETRDTSVRSYSMGKQQDFLHTLDGTRDPRRWGGIASWAQGVAEHLAMTADGFVLCERYGLVAPRVPGRPLPSHKHSPSIPALALTGAAQDSG